MKTYRSNSGFTIFKTNRTTGFIRKNKIVLSIFMLVLVAGTLLTGILLLSSKEFRRLKEILRFE